MTAIANNISIWAAEDSSMRSKRQPDFSHTERKPKTALSQAFLQAADKAYEALKQSGELQRIRERQAFQDQLNHEQTS